MTEKEMTDAPASFASAAEALAHYHAYSNGEACFQARIDAVMASLRDYIAANPQVIYAMIAAEGARIVLATYFNARKAFTTTLRTGAIPAYEACPYERCGDRHTHCKRPGAFDNNVLRVHSEFPTGDPFDGWFLAYKRHGRHDSIDFVLVHRDDDGPGGSGREEGVRD